MQNRLLPEEEGKRSPSVSTGNPKENPVTLTLYSSPAGRYHNLRAEAPAALPPAPFEHFEPTESFEPSAPFEP